MQIRVGTRQDEPIIRSIVAQAMEEHGANADLAGADSDLHDIDANYFWHDGCLVVAEEEGQILGVAGARKHGTSDDDLELLRLAVVPARRNKGVAKLLVDTILFFAGKSEYKRVISFPQTPDMAGNLQKLGFKKQADGKTWCIVLAEHWEMPARVWGSA